MRRASHRVRAHERCRALVQPLRMVSRLSRVCRWAQRGTRLVLLSRAHDIASQKQHKSISATDVLKALEQLDMGDMVQKLEQDLQGV